MAEQIFDLPDYTDLVQVTWSFPNPLVTVPFHSEGAIPQANVPITINVNEGLGRNAGTGYLTNDGPGVMKFWVSHDGEEYPIDGTLDVLEVLTLEGLNVHTIKIQADEAGTQYRLMAV